MCIEITKLTKPDEKIRYGWKVFKEYENELVGEMKGNKEPLPIGKWVHEKDYRTPLHQNKRRNIRQGYPYGFHIFKSKKDAKIWQRWGPDSELLVVMKVAYKQKAAEGKQFLFTTSNPRGKCVIAKQIKIIKPKRRKHGKRKK